MYGQIARGQPYDAKSLESRPACLLVPYWTLASFSRLAACKTLASKQSCQSLPNKGPALLQASKVFDPYRHKTARHGNAAPEPLT